MTTVLFSVALVCGLLSIVGGWILSDIGAVIGGAVLTVIGGVGIIFARRRRMSPGNKDGYQRHQGGTE